MDQTTIQVQEEGRGRGVLDELVHFAEKIMEPEVCHGAIGTDLVVRCQPPRHE